MQLQANPIVTQDRMILSLSRESGLSVPEVREMYLREWDKLSAQAKLTEFLPVLAGRHVRDDIRRRKVEITARARLLP